MKAFFDDRQSAHDPRHFVSSGQMANNPEEPKRVEVLSQRAINAGSMLTAPTDFGMGPIGEIHSPRYLRFFAHCFYMLANVSEQYWRSYSLNPPFFTK